MQVHISLSVGKKGNRIEKSDLADATSKLVSALKKAGFKPFDFSSSMVSQTIGGVVTLSNGEDLELQIQISVPKRKIVLSVYDDNLKVKRELPYEGIQSLNLSKLVIHELKKV